MDWIGCVTRPEDGELCIVETETDVEENMVIEGLGQVQDMQCVSGEPFSRVVSNV